MVKTRHHVPDWLRALGSNDLPERLCVNGTTYHRVKTFKHDFFAATGLYESAQGKAVLKAGRSAPIFGFPLNWIGRLLARHEARLYNLTQSIDGVPRFLGHWRDTGIIHEYVEGRPLARSDRPGDDFFPRLAAMLEAIHRLDAAYVDLEKPENILLGEDGSPHLIDFQISHHLPVNRFGNTEINRLILRVLQQSDRYHLLKHWRRLRPDQLAERPELTTDAIPIWIKLHRLIFRPMTQIRRRILVLLGARTSAKGRSPG